MSATAAAVHGGDDADGGLAALGAVLFAKEIPNTHGNGRTCATCHVPDDAFGLTPQHVEERYQLLQRRRRYNPNADDPLFRSIDANDGGEDFTHLRRHALVRVFIRLPTGAEGRKLAWPVDDPAVRCGGRSQGGRVSWPPRTPPPPDEAFPPVFLRLQSAQPLHCCAALATWRESWSSQSEAGPTR